MQIEVEKTEKVHISMKQMEAITVEFLEQKYRIKKDMWINDENHLMREYEQSAGSHSFTEKVLVRVATLEDQLVLKMLKNIIA